MLTYQHVPPQLVSVPGCPRGYVGPGGLHDWSEARNNSGCVGGVTGYIDRTFFTEPHIYGNPTTRPVYSSGPFDPEGIFGSLTSIFQVTVLGAMHETSFC